MQGYHGVVGVALGLAALAGCVEAREEAPARAEEFGEPAPCGPGGECPPGHVCAPADDDCDEEEGGCPGGCQWAGCAGLFGVSCPDGQVCVDDPGDECEPLRGGADCLGLCVAPPDPRPRPRPLRPAPSRCADPARSYVSHDLEMCAQVLFVCEPDWLPFYDACGCGCVQT